MTYQQNQQSNVTTSYSKFDFGTICAGVLFLVKNPTHLERLGSYLTPESFFVNDETEPVKALRRMVKLLLELKTKQGIGVINPIYFDAKLKGSLGSEDDIAAYQLFSSIKADPDIIAKSSDSGCQGIFLDFLKANRIIKWADKFTPKWKKGEMSDATQSMKELIADLDKIKFISMSEDIDFGKMSISEITNFLSISNEQIGELFYIGNSGLDSAIGGFERKALHVFIGPTNSGKSMMTHHLISRSILQNLMIHIAVVEDRPKSFMRRLIANLTGIKINRIKFAGAFNEPQLTKDELILINQAKEKINKHVKIDFCYGESIATIHQRKIEYDAERQSKGLQPYDVDIIDYSGHIAVNSAGDKMYEKYRNAFAERKDFCLLYNKIGFDFAQLNREGFKKKETGVVMSHGDLAGAYDLSQVCDNIIVLYRTKEHESSNDMALVVTKVKDGILSRDGYLVGTEFECARWNMEKHHGSKTVDMAQTIRPKDDSKEANL